MLVSALMNRWSTYRVAFLVTTVMLSTLSSKAQDQTAAAQTFAQSMLKLFDNGECSKLYDAFDESAKTGTREQWVKICSTILKQRGSVVNRSLANKTKSMGIYRFIFNTQCTEGKVFEDVGVSYKETEWKLVGFYVRPNLE